MTSTQTAPCGKGLRNLLVDHLSSTSITADPVNGNQLTAMRYYPWGEERYANGTLNTTIRFTGQRQEEQLGGSEGLYYFNARWYDPVLGRFASPDTIVPEPYNPQDWDRYAYVRNNPVRYNDPTGHWADDGCSTGSCRLSQRDKEENASKEARWLADNYKNRCEAGDPAYCGTHPAEIASFVVPSLIAVGFMPEIIAATINYLFPIGSALCADADCMNETKASTEIAERGVVFFENNWKKVGHIMQDRHAWDLITQLSGDMFKDYKAIQPFLAQVVENGQRVVIGATKQGQPVVQYVSTINGQIVVFRGVEIASNVLRITDAWVKTK